MTPGPGIEPGPQWWKASALTTAPSLLPNIINCLLKKKRIVDVKPTLNVQTDLFHGKIYFYDNRRNSRALIG